MQNPPPLRPLRQFKAAIEVLALVVANLAPTEVALVCAVVFIIVRWLLERERARPQGDGLARALLDHLEGDAPDFRKAMIDYFNGDGPAWCLPPGEWMITRYDWTRATTVVVAVFAENGAAEAELERLRAVELADKANGKVPRPQHYAIIKRSGG